MNLLRRLWNRRSNATTTEDWKEITFAQLLGASAANPDPCDCSLHRLGELATPITIDDKDAAFIGNPFILGGDASGDRNKEL